jgi:hypothetical protein
MTLASTLSSSLSSFSSADLSLLKAYPIPLFLLAILLLRLLTNRFRRGIWNIPGPTLAKYTSLWKLRDVWKGDSHNTSIKLHKKYGKLVRIGPKHISVGDPKAIPVIYGLNKGFTKVKKDLSLCCTLRYRLCFLC